MDRPFLHLPPLLQVYQADALSALTPLTESYWESFHTYRLEWMPGQDGYLAWYLGA